MKRPIQTNEGSFHTTVCLLGVWTMFPSFLAKTEIYAVNRTFKRKKEKKSNTYKLYNFNINKPWRNFYSYSVLSHDFPKQIQNGGRRLYWIS